jgi:hypothetical protein
MRDDFHRSGVSGGMEDGKWKMERRSREVGDIEESIRWDGF